MIITKQKDYSGISVSEIKEDLNVFSDDTSYNGVITRYIKTAVSEVESYVNDDVVPTYSTLEETSYIVPFGYCIYDIPETNVTVSAVTLTYNETVTTGITFYVEKYQNFTRLKFNTTITGNKLDIAYSSGYSEIPPAILQAISIKVGSYLDYERSGYLANNLTANKAFERLLSSFKTLY